MLASRQQENAKLVILVGIDEPAYRFLPGIGRTHYGGRCAAPTFGEIAKRSLKYMGEEPDDPYGHPVGDPRRDIEKSDMFKEVKTLKDLFQKLAQIAPSLPFLKNKQICKII